MNNIYKLLMVMIFLTLPIHAFSSNKEDGSLMQNALQSGKLTNELIEILKKYSNNPNGWSALNWAIQQQDYVSASIIADYSKDINKVDENYSPINRIFSITRFRGKNLLDSQIKLIKKLIDKGAKCVW